ncbi:MAG: cyclic nucleotide-binding domain-containing protein [Myxococcota bacterium]
MATGIRQAATRARGADDVVKVLDHPQTLIAADGLGAGGAAAAALAVHAVERRAPILEKLARATETDRQSGARLALGRTLERLFEEIHAEIGAGAAPGTGTSLEVVVVSGEHAHIAHVGATRTYLLRDGRLRALTEDHTLGMVRVKQGVMSADAYRSSALRDKLYQALGAGEADIDVDFSTVRLADGDVLLVTTSGAHAALDDAELVDALGRPDAEAAAEALVERAVGSGTTRDVAVVVATVASNAAPAALDAVAAALAQTAVFAELTEPERLLTAPYLDPVSLDRGQVLFEAGAPADAFYVVLEGRVRVTRHGTALTEIGPGGSFGELCLAGPATTRTAAVVALEPVSLLRLTRDRFDEIIARKPAIGTKLLRRSLDWIGARLGDLTERLARVEQLAVGEVKPGDLSLRTAIVLAARGEWGA